MKSLPRQFIGLLWAAGLAVAGLAFPGQVYAALQLNSATLSVVSPAQGPGTVVYVKAGGTITVALNGSTIGTTNWQASSWQIGAGAVTCTNHANFNTNNATTTIPITITAASVAGIYNASFIAYSNNGCTANASNTLVLSASIVVDTTAPGTTSIIPANANPTSATSVSWTVTFSESVVGVAAGNFTLAQAGGLSGAAITSVTGSGTTWTVTASTGTGNGTLGLNLASAAGITDIAGNALTGIPFNGGVYTVSGGTAVTVTGSPTLCVDDPGIGTQAWTGLTNVGAQDNVYAQASGRNGQITHYLKCTGYNFTIPAGATINGITVGVWDYSRRTMSDQAMQLVKADIIQSTNFATVTRFAGTNTQVLYGGATNLWGNTWTPADINDNLFGAAFAAIRGPFNTTDTAYVDYMPITIDYSTSSVPDHLEIQSAATGLTCIPSTLTIKACADAACTPYTGGVTGTLSAAGSPTVNWSGGVSFSIPSGSSTITKDVQVTTPGSVVFDAVSTPSAVSATTCSFGTPGCTFTASDTGFLVSAPNHAAETSATLTVQAVKKADSSLVCVPAFASISKTVNLKCAYSNPVSGTLPVRVGGTALNAAGNAAAACDGTGANVALAFDASGIATPTLQYADVGQMNVIATYTGTAGSLDAGLSMTGTGSFIAAPASFSFSAITAGAIKAGNPFGVTVSALNNAGAVTPNFGKESSAEGVALTSSLVTPDPVSFPAAVNPVPGNNVIAGSEFGGGGMVSDANGVATVNNLSWDEVGSISLLAALTNTYGYLGTAATPTKDALNNILAANGSSATVGAFIPDHFDTAVVATVTLPMPCPSGLTCPALYNGFVYSGQPFSLQVTARNLAGSTTRNYNSAYGLSHDATLTAWDALGSVTTQDPGNGVLSNGTLVSTAFSSGAGLTSTLAYTFASAPTNPTSIFLRAVDAVDTTVISRRATPATSVEGGVKVVSGMVKISNAHGTEVLDLPMSAMVQYYDGTFWLTSSTDSVTNLTLDLSNYQRITGGTWTTTPAPASGQVSAGILPFILSKPSAGGTGSVDVSISAPDYLLTASNGAAVNPSRLGRATFGVYKGGSKLIYRRENY